jgi:hypothetical protein
MNAPKNTAEISLHGNEIDSHSVSVDVLVKALEGIQQTVLLLGALQSGIEVKQRFRPTEELRKQYTLICKVPQACCYAMPVELEDKRSQPDINSKQLAGEVLENVQILLKGISSSDETSIRKILPDTRMRYRALKAIQEFLPKSGDAWTVGYKSGDNAIVKMNPQNSKIVEKWANSTLVEESANITVTGTLIRVDFEKNLVVLRYAPTGKEIECIYLPEVEDSIVDSRRDLIQVTGSFVVDDDGHPRRLTEVSKIVPLDLSTMVFKSLKSDIGDDFCFNPPLAVDPVLDDSEQLLVIENDELNIHVFGNTREQLESELLEQLEFLWAEYVQENDDALTDDAIALRQALTDRIKRGSDDAANQ